MHYTPGFSHLPGTKDATASDPPLSSLTGHPVHRTFRSRSIALTSTSSWNRNLWTSCRTPRPTGGGRKLCVCVWEGAPTDYPRDTIREHRNMELRPCATVCKLYLGGTLSLQCAHTHDYLVRRPGLYGAVDLIKAFLRRAKRIKTARTL